MTCGTKGGQYRDRVTWKQDSSAAGDPVPSYGTTLATRVPCRITAITGDETWRGRQLEGHIDYVVEMRYSRSLADSMRATDRGYVAAGVFNGRQLNVEWIKVIPYQMGKPPITEVYCRELQV